MTREIQKKSKKKLSKRIVAMFMLALMMIMTVVPAFAEGETPAPTEPAQLKINFNTGDIFSWTQMMIDSYMPVLVITIGISLAFVIIYQLRNVFR